MIYSPFSCAISDNTDWSSKSFITISKHFSHVAVDKISTDLFQNVVITQPLINTSHDDEIGCY